MQKQKNALEVRKAAGILRFFLASLFGFRALLLSKPLKQTTMNPIVRNILAVFVGIVVGAIVNVLLVNLGPIFISPPTGANITTMEGLKASMHLFEPKHFIFPWLGHAVGTLVGAYLVAKIAATRKMMLAWLIGIIFLAGGIMMVVQLPSPMWFNALDLIGAYMPMAWLGHKIAT